MNRFSRLTAPWLSAAMLSLWMIPTGAGAVEITISCGAVGQEMAICQAGAERWAAQSGHSVRVVPTPNSSSERLALYQQLLAAHAPDIDIFQIDVVWPGALSRHLVDLRPLLDPAETAAHFPAMIENNVVADRLVALPWFTAAGLLYYRRDLLEKHGRTVPETWAELTETARTIQAAERAAGDAGMWGYVWQGRAYEGLTCNALEWIASHGGGAVLAADGRPDLDNDGAAQALALAASWVGGVSPPGVLNYAEEEARGLFQSGEALFMRNWPYAWPLLNAEESPVRGRVGVAPLPRGEGGAPAATLGGWQLALSRYSAHPQEALDLIRFLTGAEEQKRRAIEGGFKPTRPALYHDADILAADPFLESLLPVFQSAVARPSRAAGRSYNRVSNAFWTTVHGVLSGRAEPEEALGHLEIRLRRLVRSRMR